MWKWAVAYAPNDFVSPLTDRQALRVGIEDEPGNVLSGHDRELLAKQRLEVRENDMGPGVTVILNGYYLDNTFSQFDSRGLLWLHAWILQLKCHATSHVPRN
jgi:hypothetical protein